MHTGHTDTTKSYSQKLLKINSDLAGSLSGSEEYYSAFHMRLSTPRQNYFNVVLKKT